MGKLNDEERFKHVDYHHTDIRKTFARVRAQMREQSRVKVEPVEPVYDPVVTPLVFLRRKL